MRRMGFCNCLKPINVFIFELKREKKIQKVGLSCQSFPCFSCSCSPDLTAHSLHGFPAWFAPAQVCLCLTQSCLLL